MTPIVQQYFPDDPKCQWFERIEHVEAGVRYIGLDKGLQHIAEAFDKQGPFDGVLGFSQVSSEVGQAGSAIYRLYAL